MLPPFDNVARHLWVYIVLYISWSRMQLLGGVLDFSVFLFFSAGGGGGDEDGGGWAGNLRVLGGGDLQRQQPEMFYGLCVCALCGCVCALAGYPLSFVQGSKDGD